MLRKDLVKVGVAALVMVLMAGCAEIPQEQTSTPSAPVAAPAPAAPAATAPATAPAVTASPQAQKLVGKWVGKWVVDGLGHEGKAELNITGVVNGELQGDSTWYDTPFGDLQEPFAPGIVNADGSIDVTHKNNAKYTLKSADAGTKEVLKGTFTYEVYTGTLVFTKQ